MQIHNNRTDDYGHQDGVQANKEDSIKISKKLVSEIKKLIEPYVQSCEEYEPDKDLRINGAPAVKVQNGKLVIAPDIKCISKKGEVFWIEVKDKCQRFYQPDTGADLHQVLGWYEINKELQEPVLLVFKDASESECTAKKLENMQQAMYDNKLEIFKQRWNRFSGALYGNWLSKCITFSNEPKYPFVTLERTRNMPINIFYFHVDNMLKIEDNIKSIFDSLTTAKNISEIKAYYKQDGEVKDFIKLQELSNKSLNIQDKK